jgi:hypothetical protein
VDTRRLGGAITVYRPDPIAAARERTPMTTVRIAHAEPQPGKVGDGGFYTRGFLVVLADDAGDRALPIPRRAGRPGDGPAGGGGTR